MFNYLSLPTLKDKSGVTLVVTNFKQSKHFQNAAMDISNVDKAVTSYLLVVSPAIKVAISFNYRMLIMARRGVGRMAHRAILGWGAD